MFTGLIEAVGHMTSLTRSPAGLQIQVRTELAPKLRPGDSVAVNGVCLTVTGTSGGAMAADIGPETARVTTLGSLDTGALVNLERPLRAGQGLGGHFVQGHVDGTAAVTDVREDGDAHWIAIELPGALAPFVIPKGSIALDGVSLTIAGLDGHRVEVMIIPFTWTHTNLASLSPGGRVNVECDMLGKYVARAVECYGAAAPDSRPGIGASGPGARER